MGVGVKVGSGVDVAVAVGTGVSVGVVVGSGNGVADMQEENNKERTRANGRKCFIVQPHTV